jgi:predicted phage baseplate assembly protein
MFGPHAFRRRLARAIVGADYGALAQEHRGVQRAAGALVWTGSWYEAQVAVDPSGQTDAGDALLSAIEAQLRPYRRIGHDLAVTHATYVPIHLEITICVKTGYLRGHVEAALLDLFSNRVLPAGGRGFFHPDNLTFGSPIYLSALIAAALSVDGVETATVDSIRRLDAPGVVGEMLAREQGVLAVGPFEIPRLDNDPAQPENGTLKLTLKGGR